MKHKFTPKPETCRNISIKFDEIMILLAIATEEIHLALPPESEKVRDLRPVIYKTMLFDFIDNMTTQGQRVYTEYARLCGMIP